MPNPAEVASLSVGGKAYASWTSFRLRRMYGGATASDFMFLAAEPLDTSSVNYSDWRITPLDTCTITLAGILAFTGYVFTRQGSFDGKRHGLMVTGRSLTANAVDSSVPISGGQFKNYTFQAIASSLAQSVGVNLIVKGSSPTLSMPFPQFSVAYGETVFSAVERLARLRGLHLTDDANGNWIASVFNPSASSVAQLIEGKNLVEARAMIDGSNSYNVTNIVAQCPGNDQINGEAARDHSATLVNPNVPAGRRTTIVLEEPGSWQDCVTRANHEMAYNATDIVDCHCVVQGWQSSPGVLWDVGQNYSVQSPMLDLDRVLASREVVYTQSELGSRTEINLCTTQSLAFSTTPIGGTVQQGEPAYASDVSGQGALPDQPDN